MKGSARVTTPSRLPAGSPPPEHLLKNLTAGRGKIRSAGSQPQCHRLGCRKVDLKPSDSSVVTGTSLGLCLEQQIESGPDCEEEIHLKVHPVHQVTKPPSGPAEEGNNLDQFLQMLVLSSQ